MEVRVYLGLSLDGFLAAPDGVPAWEGLERPGKVDAAMYGYADFMREISMLVMGRTTYDGCREAFGEHWPWHDKHVMVLTHRPLPAANPPGVLPWHQGVAALLSDLRSPRQSGHIHLLGGAEAIASFRAIQAIDRYDLYLIPVLLGAGIPFSPPKANPQQLTLESHTIFPNGVAKLVYRPIRGSAA